VARSAIAWRDVLAFLKTRAGLLDGVVFCGGAVPERFAEVLPLTDWVGFDVKAPFDGYALITGSPRSGAAARASLELLLASGKPHEIRTTVHSRLFDGPSLRRMAEELDALRITRWVFQEFRPHPQVALAVDPYGESDLAEVHASRLQIMWR
jgi:pyruvate formate lyase activating enzyme